LSVTKIKPPLGFDPEVWVPGSLDIHELRQEIYAVVDTGGKREGNSVALE